MRGRPDVHPLNPICSCATDQEHPSDVSTDRGKLLPQDTVPTPSSSVNDLPLLGEGTHDAEREVQVHPQRLGDVRHVRRLQTLQMA